MHGQVRKVPLGCLQIEYQGITHFRVWSLKGTFSAGAGIDLPSQLDSILPANTTLISEKTKMIDIDISFDPRASRW